MKGTFGTTLIMTLNRAVSSLVVFTQQKELQQKDRRVPIMDSNVEKETQFSLFFVLTPAVQVLRFCRSNRHITLGIGSKIRFSFNIAREPLQELMN